MGGGLLAGTGPAVVARDASTLDVFVTGGNSALWQKTYSGGSWSGFISRGGGLASSPAATSRSSSTMDVFARGGDNYLWEKSYNSNWGSWTAIGGL